MNNIKITAKRKDFITVLMSFFFIGGTLQFIYLAWKILQVGIEGNGASIIFVITVNMLFFFIAFMFHRRSRKLLVTNNALKIISYNSENDITVERNEILWWDLKSSNPEGDWGDNIQVKTKTKMLTIKEIEFDKFYEVYTFLSRNYLGKKREYIVE